VSHVGELVILMSHIIGESHCWVVLVSRVGSHIGELY